MNLFTFTHCEKLMMRCKAQPAFQWQKIDLSGSYLYLCLNIFVILSLSDLTDVWL